MTSLDSSAWLETLRSHVHTSPSHEQWRTICQHLTNAPPSVLDMGVEYVREAIASWPTSLLYPYWPWFSPDHNERLHAGDPRLSLIRRLSLGSPQLFQHVHNLNPRLSLPNIESIDLALQHLSNQDLKRLTAPSWHLPNLKSLHLAFPSPHNQDADNITHLLHSPTTQHLDVLSLQNTPLSHHVLTDLTPSNPLKRLRALRITHTSYNRPNLPTKLFTPLLNENPNLRNLWLSGVQSRNLRTLAQTSGLYTLHHLHWTNTGLTTQHLNDFLHALHSPTHLLSLNVSRNAITTPNLNLPNIFPKLHSFCLTHHQDPTHHLHTLLKNTDIGLRLALFQGNALHHNHQAARDQEHDWLSLFQPDPIRNLLQHTQTFPHAAASIYAFLRLLLQYDALPPIPTHRVPHTIDILLDALRTPPPQPPLGDFIQHNPPQYNHEPPALLGLVQSDKDRVQDALIEQLPHAQTPPRASGIADGLVRLQHNPRKTLQTFLALKHHSIALQGIIHFAHALPLPHRDILPLYHHALKTSHPLQSISNAFHRVLELPNITLDDLWPSLQPLLSSNFPHARERNAQPLYYKIFQALHSLPSTPETTTKLFQHINRELPKHPRGLFQVLALQAIERLADHPRELVHTLHKTLDSTNTQVSVDALRALLKHHPDTLSEHNISAHITSALTQNPEIARQAFTLLARSKHPVSNILPDLFASIAPNSRLIFVFISALNLVVQRPQLCTPSLRTQLLSFTKHPHPGVQHRALQVLLPKPLHSLDRLPNDRPPALIAQDLHIALQSTSKSTRRYATRVLDRLLRHIPSDLQRDLIHTCLESPYAPVRARGRRLRALYSDADTGSGAMQSNTDAS